MYTGTDLQRPVRNDERYQFAQTMAFSFFLAIDGVDGDTAFQGIDGHCEAFPFKSQRFFVFLRYRSIVAF